MLVALILIVCLGALVVTYGLSTSLGSDSPLPDRIGFFVLAVMVATCCWLIGAWWVLAPVAALVLWVHWLDKDIRDGPADLSTLDERGSSGRTRIRRLRLMVAVIVAAALFGAIFILPATGADFAILELLIPSFVVALVAMGLFRFSYYRSVRRDDSA